MSLSKRKVILFFILIIALVGLFERMLYASGEAVLKNKVRTTLLETIEDGFNAQYKALNLYEAGFKIEPGRTFEHCKVICEDKEVVKDIIVDKNKTIVSSDLDTQIRHSILAEEGIDAEACLSLWSKKLSAIDVSSSHALQIHNCVNHADSTSVLTCGDSALFSSKYKKIESIYTGFSNKIEVASFIHYSWFTVLKNASTVMWVITVSIFLVLLFVSLIYFQRKRVPVKENISQSAISLANLRYVYSSHDFYVDNRKIQVRAQSASLLLLFLQAPSYTVTKEEIISCLWKPEDSGVDNRLRRSISDLRSLFKEESVNISIKTSKSSYSLIV